MPAPQPGMKLANRAAPGIEGNCGGQFSLRKLNPVLRKMLVLGDGFGQLEPSHHIKGKAVGQTQSAAAANPQS